MKHIKRAALYLAAAAASFLSVFPLYWMIAAATNNSTDVLAGKLTFGASLGANIAKLFAQQDVGRAVAQSVFY